MKKELFCLVRLKYMKFYWNFSKSDQYGYLEKPRLYENKFFLGTYLNIVPKLGKISEPK